MICQEDNSLIWLSDGRHLIRAAPTQLRLGCELDEEMVSAREACRVVNISDVPKSSRHGGIEDISSGDLPDDKLDEDSHPGDPEDHEQEDELEDKTMGLKIPPLLRPLPPVPGEIVELGARAEHKRQEVHQQRLQESHRRRLRDLQARNKNKKKQKHHWLSRTMLMQKAGLDNEKA